MALDVCFHFGTLLSILVYYRKPLGSALSNGFFSDPGKRRFTGLVLVGIMPAGAAGWFFSASFERFFNDPLSASLFLLCTGVVLASTRRIRRNAGRPLTAGRALGVGFAQVFALFPGISRAGTTIAAGLHLGLSPETATRYSFYMAVPLLCGAVLRELPAILSMPSEQAGWIAAGTLVSFVSGVAAIRWTIASLHSRKFHRFAYYCFVLALSGIAGITLKGV
jgi:undecaprenyl-diphosphatase